MSPERIRPGSARAGRGENEEPRASAPAEPNETAPAEIEPAEIEPAEIGTDEITVAEPVEVAASTEIGGEAREELPAEPAEPGSPVVRRHRAFRRLYYGETRFDFVRRWRVWFVISGIIILSGAISLGTRGLNLSIEFVGGTSWTVKAPPSLTVAKVQAALPASLSTATVTLLGSGSSKTIDVEAKLPKGSTPQANQTEADQFASTLAGLAKTNANAVSIETVGPSWGGDITTKAVQALIVFFILIALYISIFFEWRMALAAIIAVAHDILITVGIYSLSGFLVTPDTVVAFLTILGYSLYDTIVVFDRVHDNTKAIGGSGRISYSDLVNLSMNQTLARSMNTSLVAILPILSVLVLGAQLLGATTLQYFGLALLIGLTTGAYSSIFIASPLVALLKEREPRYRQLQQRLASRGIERLLISPAAFAAGALTAERAAASTLRSTARQGGRRPVARGNTTASEPDLDGEITGDEVAPRPAPPRRPNPPRQRSNRPASRSKKRGGRR